MRNPVMQMDLRLAPSRVAMLSQNFDQAFVILLRRIKIGVNKRPAFMVAPPVGCLRILATPPLQAPLLLRARNPLLPILRIDGRFEVIGYGNNQVHRLAHRGAQCAPHPRRQHLSDICNFFSQTHLGRPQQLFIWGVRMPAAASLNAKGYARRAGLRPRTAIEDSPTRMSSIPIASYQRNTSS